MKQTSNEVDSLLISREVLMTTQKEPIAPIMFTVHPTRLHCGMWCPDASSRRIGQGDISASRSVDRIVSGKPICKPFRWQGGLWISVGALYRPGQLPEHEAYRVVPVVSFRGPTTSYNEKTRDGDAARSDPNGFYHGMLVKYAGGSYVLCGPPALFTAEAAQESGVPVRPHQQMELGL